MTCLILLPPGTGGLDLGELLNKTFSPVFAVSEKVIKTVDELFVQGVMYSKRQDPSSGVVIFED